MNKDGEVGRPDSLISACISHLRCSHSICRRIVNKRQLIAVGIADVGAVKTVAILRPVTGTAFVTSAELQGEGMQFRNMCDGAGVKRHHRSITHPGRLLVKRNTHAQPAGVIAVEGAPGRPLFVTAGLDVSQQRH